MPNHETMIYLLLLLHIWISSNTGLDTRSLSRPSIIVRDGGNCNSNVRTFFPSPEIDSQKYSNSFSTFLTFCHELITLGNLTVNLKLSGVFLYQIPYYKRIRHPIKSRINFHEIENLTIVAQPLRIFNIRRIEQPLPGWITPSRTTYVVLQGSIIIT